MMVGHTDIRIVRGDITELAVGAIVNAANNRLIMGGGVAGAIRKKGGRSIEEEAMKKGPVKVGDAVWTSGGALKARYVIHAATMGMDFKTDEAKVRASCANALKTAQGLGIDSVAFPALGCGVGGFPYLASAKIMAQEVLKYIRESETCLKEVVFCLYDEEAYKIFQKGVISYLEHVTKNLQKGPFTTVDGIIEVDGGIVLIERSNPPFGMALPGGFVDYGESLEDALRREMREETSLKLEALRQFHTYSDGSRDPRFHTISTVFVARGKGRPVSGDDAASLKVVRPEDALGLDLAFDHKRIIRDYIEYKKGSDPFISQVEVVS